MILGLSGGPGTGKSLAAEYLRKQGAVIISGDEAGRRAVEEYPGVLKKLVKTFGNGILSYDGSLNRKQVGRIVFSNNGALEALNATVHPQLLKILKSDIRKFNGHKKRLIVLDAALIYEWGIANWCDYILVVTAGRELRIKRLTQRGLTRSEAKNRIASQIPDREKRKLADFVIENNGTKKLLEKRIMKFMTDLETLTKHNNTISPIG